MDGRLASDTVQGCQGQLHAAGVAISQLGHGRRPSRPDRRRRLPGRGRTLPPLRGFDLLVRKLKGLDDVISVCVVEPGLTAQGWRFGDDPGANRDALNGATYLHEIYTLADPLYSGRATVPVLWDKQRRTIVNNESAEIVRMLNDPFGKFATHDIDLYPPDLSPQIEALNEPIYRKLNNGVYRAGFASTQQAYEEACRDVFEMLDELERRLERRSFMLGERMTETDVRLFVTLVRFDAAYHGLFKCNLRRLIDYPNLAAYMGRVLAVPGAQETVNIDHNFLAFSRSHQVAHDCTKC